MPFLITRARVTPVSISWVATVTSMYHHAQMPWKVYHTDQNPCEIVTQYTLVKMFALLHYDIIGYRKKWAIAITCHLNVSCFSSGAWCMCVCMFMCMGTCVHRPEADAGCLSLINLHCIFWTRRSSPLRLQWSGSELPGSFLLCLPSTRATQTWLSTQAWELERQESALQVSYSLSRLQQFVLIGCLERLWVTWEINDRYSLILQRRDSWEQDSKMIGIYRPFTQTQPAESGFPRIHYTVDCLGRQLGNSSHEEHRTAQTTEGQLLQTLA